MDGCRTAIKGAPGTQTELGETIFDICRAERGRKMLSIPTSTTDRTIVRNRSLNRKMEVLVSELLWERNRVVGSETLESTHSWDSRTIWLGGLGLRDILGQV